ncbi:MAG: hypothetical protein HZB62_11010 [Nitrospirae bacterium]|nr:hypothetical protein [Nitrospirota bacterium]
MNSLNIDFRGENLRVLSAKDGVLKHVLISRNFSISDLKNAQQQLTAAIKEAGGKKGNVHVILPHKILKFGIFQVPAMDIADAEKVVRRDIAKELGSQDFVLGIRRIMNNRPGKQDILAEYALTSDIQIYLTLLKQCGIKPALITTSLEGIISAFKKVRPETEGNEAVLEIGQSFMEILVFNDSRLINYKKVQMPAVDDAKLSSKDKEPEQVFKMKMYTIVDALYNFIMAAGSGAAEDKISRLWISGLGSVEKGMPEVLSESLSLSSMLINPFVSTPLRGTSAPEGDADVEDASIYTAIAGLSMLTPGDPVVNLIPAADRDKGRQVLEKTGLIVALAFYAILIGGGYTVLSRTEKDLRTLKDRSDTETKASQKSGVQDKSQQDALRKIMNNNKSLYPLFRDIANLTPPVISLTSLDVEKTAEATFIKLGTNLQSADEGLRKSALSKFLNALETTGRFALAAPPEITTTTAAPNTKKQEFTVKAKFEVLQ